MGRDSHLSTKFRVDLLSDASIADQIEESVAASLACFGRRGVNPRQPRNPSGPASDERPPPRE